MSNVCYHHSNCHDRQVVATCSVCGNSLCGECSNKFKQSGTGKSLCVDCFNKELKRNEAVNLDLARKHQNKGKLLIIFSIIFGAFPIMIGLISILVNLGNADDMLMGLYAIIIGVWLSSVLTAMWYILRFTGKIIRNSTGFLKVILGIIGFFIGVIIAPVFFVVNLTKHLKDAKRYKEWALWASDTIKANEQFLLRARSMKSGLENSPETIALKQQVTSLQAKLNEEKKKDGNEAVVAQLLAQMESFKSALEAQKREANAIHAELEENKRGDAEMMQKFDSFKKFISMHQVAEAH